MIAAIIGEQVVGDAVVATSGARHSPMMTLKLGRSRDDDALGSVTAPRALGRAAAWYGAPARSCGSRVPVFASVLGGTGGVRRFAASISIDWAATSGSGAVEHDYRDGMTIRLGVREDPVRR